LTLRIAPAALLLAIALNSGSARAEVTLFDRDGWSFYTTGLVAAHYQYISGDGDPLTMGKALAGGRILDEQTATDQRDNTIKLSNIRSGFIGTQIGFGVNRQISQDVRVISLLAVSVDGINSNRGQAVIKDVDYREAWAAIESKWGTLKFGRMFGMFGEGAAEVMLMAWQYGVGHPCVINGAGMSCGSSGAGPIYPGFDGAIRYISPRIFGFQLGVSVADPNVGLGLKMSPQPRVDGELNFDQVFGPVRLRLIGQSMWNQIAQSTSPTMMNPEGTLKAVTIWGAMGTGLATIAFPSGSLTLAGGGWTGKGVGERVPLEATDAANPIAFDNTQELRGFNGVYGNAQLQFMDHSLTVGGGQLKISPTAADDAATFNLVLLKNAEWHVTYHYKWDAIVFNVEFMHWTSDWHDDPMMPMMAAPHQGLNFMGGGVNYLW
jgi:predicted porin